MNRSYRVPIPGLSYLECNEEEFEQLKAMLAAAVETLPRIKLAGKGIVNTTVLTA